MNESASVRASWPSPDQIFLIDPVLPVSVFWISKIILRVSSEIRFYSEQGPQGQVQNIPH